MNDFIVYILVQVITQYTGAFLLSIYFKLWKKENISIKEIIQEKNNELNPLNVTAYYVGFTFFIVISMIIFFFVLI